MLAREVLELELEEDEAEGVLEDLHLGILAESALPVELVDAVDGGGVVADLGEDGGGPLGVEARQAIAPFEVADAAVGEIAARDLPAHQVLATRREEQG